MKTFQALLAVMTIANATGFSALARADELVPYIECKDKADPELLISTSPDHGLFIYDKSDTLGLASKTAFALRLARSAEGLTLKAAPNDACKFVDANTSIGIATVSCSLQNGAQIKIKPADAEEKTIAIRSGSIQFYANMFYGGQASLTLDLVTADGRHVVVKKDMAYQSCNLETLPKHLRP